MDFSTFKNRISRQFKNNLPFVLFSEAGSNQIECFLQPNVKLYTNNSLTKNGFVLASFDNRLPTCLIPKAGSEAIKTNLNAVKIERKQVPVKENEQDKKQHRELLLKTIETIKKGDAEKIVISRKKDFSLSKFSIEVLIDRLFSAYPRAYRYIWFHPKTGIWCGATPEVLITVKNNILKTMALAGTQPYTKGDIVWRKKELDEQYFVTEAILDNLKTYVDDIRVSEVKTVQAGALLHLKTDIEAQLKSIPGILSEIVKTLHPTPAVCGTPQNFARKFIIENENYPRNFYTGFFGIIDDNGSTAALRVNLRCMKIQSNRSKIMIGGGITKDSDPEEEWEETRNKMQTMLQVIHPML